MRLNTANNVPLTLQEQRDLLETCTKIGYCIPASVTIMRNTDLSRKRGGGMAMFHMFHPDVIFICDDEDDWQLLLPKIAHELIHRQQYERYIFPVYCFMACPFWREWCLEKEAYAEEKYVNNEFRDILQKRSIENYRRIKKNKKG